MINPDILIIFEKSNISKAKGLAYLLSLYYNEKDVSWIDKDVIANIQILGIVKMENGIPRFKIPLFTNNAVTTVNSKQKFKNEIEEFVKTKYIPLFPTRSETGLTYDISGNTAACIDRMTKFINDFPRIFNRTDKSLVDIFSLIYQATQTYINVKRINNYAYTKKNVKFIYDEQGSELENCIRRILDGNLDVIEELFNFNKEL